MQAAPELSAETLAAAREGRRVFIAHAEDRYSLALPDLGVILEADRLRRESGQLVGELLVKCDQPKARTVNGGILSLADFNFSSARARTERARLCAQQAPGAKIDWQRLLEDFSQRVLEAERTGAPAIDLREVGRAQPEPMLCVEGFTFPRSHPTILFGDGGTCKSLLALYLAGRLAERGLGVGYFDWELDQYSHYERLERLFPDGMPRIIYAKCDRAVIHEVDRLRRIVREHDLGFAIFDSVALATDGPPEAAEAAARYFRAVRQIGIGSLHIAHVTKLDDADKPFGSVFWHNGARSTWNVKLAQSSPDGSALEIGLFERKANLGRLHSPIAFRITFDAARIDVVRTDVADSPDLAEYMTLRQRLIHLLRRGPRKLETLTAELCSDEKISPDSVRRTLQRYKQIFVALGDGLYALRERT